MTTHAPMARVPFAPLDNPRLKHLASAKNRQNGLTSQKSSLGGKPSVTPSKVTLSTKRPFEAPTCYEDVDSENVDPAMFDSPSKKSKNEHGLSSTPFTFSLSPSSKAMPPPAVPARLSTPVRANMSSPRAPMTAPAGRSPKRKAAGIHKPNRRISAPFSRIDPPFASRSTGAALPFSLDAAINGTFNASPATASSTARSSGATIQESMPKNWFFEIYEDTPEEEAGNLMEHSTLTLDLSSDDEGSAKKHDDRGKENTPPDNYDAPIASRPSTTSTALNAAPARVKKTEIIRKKILAKEEMDDDERSPLSDLETDSFIPEGLDKDSYVVVDGLPTTVTKTEKKDLFTMPAKSESRRQSLPVVSVDGDYKGEVLVWEDSSFASSEDSENVAPGSDTKA